MNLFQFCGVVLTQYQDLFYSLLLCVLDRWGSAEGCKREEKSIGERSERCSYRSTYFLSVSVLLFWVFHCVFTVLLLPLDCFYCVLLCLLLFLLCLCCVSTLLLLTFYCAFDVFTVVFAVSLSLSLSHTHTHNTM